MQTEINNMTNLQERNDYNSIQMKSVKEIMKLYEGGSKKTIEQYNSLKENIIESGIKKL